jgi:predicted ATPase
VIGALVGPYRVERELGSGGMGAVYAATVEREVAGLAAGTTVALKVVHPHLLQSDGFFKRFLREARIGQKVEHDNVVRTYDFDAYETDGQTHHCLAMEYVEGQTLRDLLSELGTVPEDLCRHVGSEMAKGLAAIHAAGAVHRDIKPENVLITPDHTIKLMDLGVARLVDESVRLSQTGAFVGSVHYAAPEQFRESSTIDGRADLHALGITLFELATGTHPFDAEELPDVIRRVLQDRPPRACDAVEGVSAFFADVIDALVEKETDARLSSADLLLSVLDEGERSPWWRDRTQSLAADRARRVRRMSLRRETPVFGRDKDLQALEKAYERAKGGDGVVVLVEGEAGIGKSRLVDELVRRLLERGEKVSFLSGGFSPAGSGAVSDGVATAFREFLGPAGAGSHLTTMPLVVPSFDAYIRGETPPEGAPVLQADSVQTCFVRLLQSIAAETPTVLLIDDLHFASQDALDLVFSLALGVPEHPVLLIATLRPGVPEKWLGNLSTRDHVEHVRLERLGSDDLTHLLEAALQSRTLAEDLSRVLADKIDGNPFFVFELLRALRDDGRLVRRDDGSWISTSALGDVRVPASIADIVRGRLADLDDEERELLEIAACHGFRFDARLVAHALGNPPLRVLQSLARISRRLGLVRSSGERFEFDHHHLHEALYGELLEPLAREYHAMLAEAIERTALATRIGDEAAQAATEVELCDQWARAGAGVRAYALVERAVQHLKDAVRLGEAVTLIDRLLAALGPAPSRERCDVLTQRGILLSSRGMGRAAVEALQSAIEVADQLQDVQRQAVARFRYAEAFYMSDDVARLRETLQDALQYCERAGDEVLVAACRGRIASAELDSGGEDCLLEQLESNARLFKERGNHSWSWTARMGMATYHMMRGCADSAESLCEELLAEALARNCHTFAATALTKLATLGGLRGRHEEAVRRGQQLRELAIDLGERSIQADAECTLGTQYLHLGRLDDAERHYLHLERIARELALPKLEYNAASSLGLLRANQGRLEEAGRYREEAAAIAERLGSLVLTARAYNALASHFGRSGDYTNAREAAERSFEAARAARLVPLTILSAASIGYLECRLGRTERSEERFAFAVRFAKENGRPVLAAGAIAGLADCAEAAGDLTSAESYMRESLGVHRRTDSNSAIAQVVGGLGRVIALQGRLGEAMPLFRESLELAEPTGNADALLVAHRLLVEHDGHDPTVLAELIDTRGEQADIVLVLHALMSLWRRTGDTAVLEDAWQRVERILELAPEENRPGMRTSMPLFRDVCDAWSDAGGEVPW